MDAEHGQEGGYAEKYHYVPNSILWNLFCESVYFE